MGDIYGCSINYYRGSEFVDGIFAVGYIDEKIEKYICEDDKPKKIDFKTPNDKTWFNCKALMPFLTKYFASYLDSIISKNSESEIKVEFEIANFCDCKRYIFTGRFTVDLGCLSLDWITDNPYTHFMLENWEYKRMAD